MKKALIFEGGWPGHDPALVSVRFMKILERHGFEVELVHSLDPLADIDYLKSFDLLVPCWTMGKIPDEIAQAICEAVLSGTGMAGCHGGMCDAFRENCDWQFMTGGQWVAHPGGDTITYKVNILPETGPITEGLEDFEVKSEQYYMHVDPAINVLATTKFTAPEYKKYSDVETVMPVAWTKQWGKGRVFYCSLGHQDYIFDKYPSAQALMERGMLWAARAVD